MERYEGKNSGSIKAIQIVKQDLISFIHKELLTFSDLELSPGVSWQDIPLTLETGNFSDRCQRNSAGLYWEKQLNFKIPALRNEISTTFLNFSGKKVVALVTDMNDRTWLVYPLRILFDQNIPETAAGYNGYTISLSGKSEYPAPEVFLEQ